MAADWSSLPGELVGLVANKFKTIEDHSAFASLCRSYRSATEAEVWRPEVVSQHPWLLLCGRDEAEAEIEDEDKSGENHPNQRGLVSLYGEVKFFMDLPELYGRHCWGTPYGWIVTLGLDMKLHLFNPLNRRRIPLPDPDLASFRGRSGPKYVRQDYIDRAILFRRTLLSSSDSDNDNNFLVVTIGRFGELRFLRGETWVELSPNSNIKDVVCYRGQIYAVSGRGRLSICSNFDGPGPPTTNEFVPQDRERFEGLNYEKFYVVELSGELLMVVRYIFEHTEDRYYHTDEFELYKLDFEKRKWVEIDDLGGNALFVGDCQSISLSQPENFNCRSNCIYYTDDNYVQFIGKGGEDMGIYDCVEHTTEPLYDVSGGVDTLSTYSTPTWFIPIRV